MRRRVTYRSRFRRPILPLGRCCSMKKKILIMMTSHGELGATGQATGAYVPEVAHPFSVFERAGFGVDLASVRGGKTPLYGMDPKDQLSAAFVERYRGALETAARAQDLMPTDYQAIFYAGGHGTMWDFPNNGDIQRLGSLIYESGGVVSAVCHGPAALLGFRLANGESLVSGRAVAAFSNDEEHAVGLAKVVPFLLEDALRAEGALINNKAVWQPQVVQSERLVTGQNPASAVGVAELVVRMLS